MLKFSFKLSDMLPLSYSNGLGCVGLSKPVPSCKQTLMHYVKLDVHKRKHTLQEE